MSPSYVATSTAKYIVQATYFDKAEMAISDIYMASYPTSLIG